MKIISDEKFKEYERIQKENKILSNGYRAMSMCLDFEKAIIGIMKECNLKEIELPLNYFANQEILEVSENKTNHSYLIRIVELKDSDIK